MRVVKSIKLCLVVICCAVVGCGAILVGLTASAAQARAAGPPATLPPPLAAPSAGLKLTQVSAGTWKTTVYLNTSALCLGTNEFSLVTAVPYTSTLDPDPDYAGGLRCTAKEQAAGPLTEVVLTFTPSPALSSVPQTATLTVTPPVSAMSLGDPPLEVPLTIRRAVSACQYVWIPVGCGAVLAALLVALVALTGVPTQTGWQRGWHPGFWRTTLYASATWTFGDSWATNTAAVTAVVAAVLSASGTVGGLIPGTDLGRFGLMMALAGGVIGIAPLFFGVLNSWSASSWSASRTGKSAGAGEPAPAGEWQESWPAPPAPPARAATGSATPPETKVSTMWVMLLASFLTVSGIGAELAIVGWVLGYDLMVAPAIARWSSLIAAVVLALLFLGYGVRAVVTLADLKGGSPLNTSKSAAFIL